MNTEKFVFKKSFFHWVFEISMAFYTCKLGCCICFLVFVKYRQLQVHRVKDYMGLVQGRIFGSNKRHQMDNQDLLHTQVHIQ